MREEAGQRDLPVLFARDVEAAGQAVVRAEFARQRASAD
jgi:hypothetical protein